MSAITGWSSWLVALLAVAVMCVGVEAQYGRCTGPSDCPPGAILVQFENMDCTGSYNITAYGAISPTCVDFNGKSVLVGSDAVSMSSGSFDSTGCAMTGDASYVSVKTFFGVCGMSPEMDSYRRSSQAGQVEVVNDDFAKLGRYLEKQKGQAPIHLKNDGKRNFQQEVIPLRGTVYLRDISELASFTGRRRMAPAVPIVPDIVYVPEADCPSLDNCHNSNSTTRPQYISARFTDDTCSTTSYVIAIEGGDWTGGRCMYSPPYTSFTETSSPSSSPSTLTPDVLSVNDGLYMRSYCKDAHALEQAFFVDSACASTFSTITSRKICASNGQETTECSATPPTAAPTSSSSFLSSSLLLSSFLFSLILMAF